MTVGEALLKAAKQLSPCSLSARLDAEVLLAHALGKARSWLLAHADAQIDPAEEARYLRLLERRSQGEPVAYLTGHKEFYGLDLIVTPAVLVPRPETESLVDACLELLPADRPATFADIGTGSGAIAVAVAKNRPLVRCWAVEIAPEALEIARANCARHELQDRVTLLQGDLLAPLPGPVDLIAANLPYVAPGDASPDVAGWEPHVAVFGGGEDGTLLIRRFLEDAPRSLQPSGSVVMETAYSQGKLVAQLARERFPDAEVQVRKDLAGYDRIVIVKTP